MRGLPPPSPIALKDRSSLVFVERAQLDVRDGAFVVVNADGTRTHIPVGGLAGLMLEPGARISHAAVSLAARTGTLITWVGEAGVRLYSAGQPGGARERTSCFGRPRSRWTRPRACGSSAPCMRIVSARLRRSAARSINCEESKVPGCARATLSWPSSTG